MKLTQSLIFCLSLISPFALYAADISNGKSLHTGNCLSCHTPNKYMPSTRSIHDLAALKTQVKRCDYSLGTQWFDDDIADVIAYLNQDYYKFKAE